jgi:hypothetical protein
MKGLVVIDECSYVDPQAFYEAIESILSPEDILRMRRINVLCVPVASNIYIIRQCIQNNHCSPRVEARNLVWLRRMYDFYNHDLPLVMSPLHFDVTEEEIDAVILEFTET